MQGEYGTQNPYLLTTMLKEEWGYEGIVISDWFAIVRWIESIGFGAKEGKPKNPNKK